MNVGDSMRCNKCDMNVELKWNYCPYCENKINSINQLELDTTKKDQIDDHCEKCGLLLEKYWKVCPKCGDKNSFFSKEAYENNSEVKKNEERKIKERKRSNSKLWVLLDVFCLTFAFPLNLIYYFFILKGFGTTLIDVFTPDGVANFIWSLIKIPIVGAGAWIGFSVVSFLVFSTFISSIYNVCVAKTKNIIWKLIFWLDILSGLIVVLFFILGSIFF